MDLCQSMKSVRDLFLSCFTHFRLYCIRQQIAQRPVHSTLLLMFTDFQFHNFTYLPIPIESRINVQPADKHVFLPPLSAIRFTWHSMWTIRIYCELRQINRKSEMNSCATRYTIGLPNKYWPPRGFILSSIQQREREKKIEFGLWISRSFNTIEFGWKNSKGSIPSTLQRL